MHLPYLTLVFLATSGLAAPGKRQATSTSTPTNTNPTTTLKATSTAKSPGLNDAARALGKLFFGTAADIPGTYETTDKYYLKEFHNRHDFGEATPANAMKFVNTEPEPGVFNFTQGDYFLDLAEQSGKLVRCHNLIWSQQLPAFITDPAEPWTNKTLSHALRRHVEGVVEHFGDRCYSWDVVNEAFSDSPAGSYSSNVWYDTIGPEYVAMAFDAAAKTIKRCGLKVKLYYNDYNIESPGAKAVAAENLVKELKARKIQIDGVGLESHFIAGSTPSLADQTTQKKRYARLGVDTAITELDVRLTLPPTVASETQQVQDYYDSVKYCVQVKRCIGIVVWDFDDTYSWIPGTFQGQGYGDLFLQPGGEGTKLVKKAAYDGVLQALRGEPEGV